MSVSRAALLLLFLVPLVLPTVAFAQATHGEETQIIEPPATPEASDAARPDLAKVEELIVKLTNEFRRQESRPELQRNPKLTATARYFADYVGRTNRFGHEADGSQPWDRAKKHGYIYCVIGENIAYDYNSAGFGTEELARRFVEEWKHSPPHRKNMLDPDFTDVGVAVAHSPRTGYYYAVQDFGRPASRRIEFRIRNNADETVRYRVGDQTYSLPPRYTRTHQQCRPTELSFLSPRKGEKGASEKGRTFKPANGQRYVIEGVNNGEVQVKTD